LLVTTGTNENLYLSGRNIKNLQVVPVGSLNALDVIACENVILGDVELVKQIEEAVAK
jgi:ribosomal protein L4